MSSKKQFNKYLKFAVLAVIFIIFALYATSIIIRYRFNSQLEQDPKYDGIPEEVQTISAVGTHSVTMQNDIEIVKLPSGATIRMDANRYGASYGNPSRTSETEEPHLVLGDDYSDNNYFSIINTKYSISHKGYSYKFSNLKCNEELITDTDVANSYYVTDCSFNVDISKL